MEAITFYYYYFCYSAVFFVVVLKSWESCCGYDAFATDVFVFLQKLLTRPTSLSQNDFK